MATATKRRGSNGLTTLKVLDHYVLGTSKFMEIPVQDLKWDDKYQRDLNERAITRLVANFDINLFEPPTVNDRSGWPGHKGVRYVLIDGKHRREVARRIGMPTITCRVVAVSPADEADLFVRLNRQRLWITAVQTYKAELVSGNPAVKEIQMCLSERELKIGSNKGPLVVTAVDSLKRIYAMGGYVGLAKVIDTILLAWPESELDRFSGNLLLATNAFYRKNPKTDQARLAQRLATVAPLYLLAKSSQRWHAWKQLGKSGADSSLVNAVTEEIGRLYRKHAGK